MIRRADYRRHVFWTAMLMVALLLLMQRTARPAVAESSLSLIRFSAPQGWKVTEMAANARLLTSPASGPRPPVGVVILLSDALPGSGFNFRASFDAAVSGMLKGRKVAERTEVVSNRTGDGYEFLSQNVAADDAQGNRLFASIAVVNVNRRLAIFCFAAPSMGAFQDNYAAFTRMLEDVHFSDTSV